MNEQRGRTFVAGAASVAAFALFAAIIVWTPSAAAPDQSQGLAAWAKIVSVLQHPRCLNCHQLNAPLQSDLAQAHTPFVTRGPDGSGTGAMRCGSCHKDANDLMTGTPGAPHWKLVPVSMVWQGLSSADLCAMLKDPKRNGGRDGAALVEHMKAEPLVLWGWAPGQGRAPIPIAHGDFVTLMHQWVASGMVCPK